MTEKDKEDQFDRELRHKRNIKIFSIIGIVLVCLIFAFVLAHHSSKVDQAKQKAQSEKVSRNINIKKHDLKHVKSSTDNVSSGSKKIKVPNPKHLPESEIKNVFRVANGINESKIMTQNDSEVLFSPAKNRIYKIYCGKLYLLGLSYTFANKYVKTHRNLNSKQKSIRLNRARSDTQSLDKMDSQINNMIAKYDKNVSYAFMFKSGNPNLNTNHLGYRQINKMYPQYSVGSND